MDASPSGLLVKVALGSLGSALFPVAFGVSVSLTEVVLTNVPR